MVSERAERHALNLFESPDRMNYRIRSAQERRAEIQAHAAQLGIDEAFISTLVEQFYQRVLSHPGLGPIFTRAVDDWTEHLPKMKDFWSSVALNSGRYSGKPVPAHKVLNGVKTEDFEIWLGLFRDTLEDLSPRADTVSYFMQRAERIAQSLQLAMFGLPDLASGLSTQKN
ncbi:MAG: group III truncated hemoglobin [Pseudomonadota bacterium]